MPMRWKIKSVDEEKVRNIAGFTSLPAPLARALALRGQQATEEVEAFLNPRLADLSDPFLFSGMRLAVARIWEAIGKGETVSVFGDYDVDGITATALLTRVLSALGAQVKPFIPSRLDEGYGLSQDALERCLAEHGPAVVVSVDCGVNSTESVAFAQSKGVDVIVTDHHEPAEQTAPAFALINPKLGCARGTEGLSGAGVAFKLAHALLKFGQETGKPVVDEVDLRDYLDLVALGSVADIVPLVGENRILVRHGLVRLGSTKWIGMQALRLVAGAKGEPDTFHLGFQLGPRINAAGRIARPMEALQLLLTEDEAEARRIAKLLDDTNTERRCIEKEMADEAFAEIDAYFDPKKDFGLVVAKEGWHPGVVGIVASRVSRRYNRPAIVMGIEGDGSAHGSCRSIDEFDLLEGLGACGRYLERFGGHKMAAGLAVKPGELDAFKACFNSAATRVLAEMDLAPLLQIDAEVYARELDQEFLEQLKRLQPFGQGNPEPVWVLNGACISGSPRVVGQKHLKMALASGGHSFDAIAFNYPLENLPSGAIDVAFNLKENHWNGGKSLQLHIKDVRAAAV